MVAPTSIALTGGRGSLSLGLVAFGVLGFLLVLAVVPVVVLGVALVLVRTATASLETAVTDKPLRILRRAETVEETHWWSPY